MTLRTAIFVALVSSGNAFADTEVSTCGQVLSGSGFLGANLDCTGFFGDAVSITGGSLDLRGFTLTAGNESGVQCDEQCTVHSSVPGGLITGAAASGVSARNVKLVNVTVDGNLIGLRVFNRLTVIDSVISNADRGIDASSARVVLVRSTISQISARAIYAGPSGSARITDSTITDVGEDCVWAGRLVVERSTISSCGETGLIANYGFKVTDSLVTMNRTGLGRAGVSLARISVTRSEVSNNAGSGIGAGRLKLKESLVVGNGGSGIRASFAQFGRISVRLVGSTVSGNQKNGVFAEDSVSSCHAKLRLVDSTVTGNALDAACGDTEPCADLSSCSLPRMSGTSSCDTSYDTLSGFPGTSWGVCALD